MNGWGEKERERKRRRYFGYDSEDNIRQRGRAEAVVEGGWRESRGVLCSGSQIKYRIYHKIYRKTALSPFFHQYDMTRMSLGIFGADGIGNTQGIRRDEKKIKVVYKTVVL